MTTQHRQKSRTLCEMTTDISSTKIVIASFCAAAVFFLLNTPVYAYLDGGTINMVLQGLIGGLAVTIASISIFWKKIWNFFFIRKTNSKEDEEETKNHESNGHSQTRKEEIPK